MRGSWVDWRFIASYSSSMHDVCRIQVGEVSHLQWWGRDGTGRDGAGSRLAHSEGEELRKTKELPILNFQQPQKKKLPGETSSDQQSTKSKGQQPHTFFFNLPWKRWNQELIRESCPEVGPIIQIIRTLVTPYFTASNTRQCSRWSARLGHASFRAFRRSFSSASSWTCSSGLLVAYACCQTE